MLPCCGERQSNLNGDAVVKKIGLGSRPSEVKGKEKQLDLDEDHVSVTPRRSGKRPRKSTASSSLFILLTVVCLVSIVAGILVSKFFLGDSTFDLAVNNARFITGQREIVVGNGDEITIAYQDGLELKRVNYRGLYRLFPPEDVHIEVTGLPGPVTAFGENIVLRLKPEETTRYEIAFSRNQARVGTIAFVLTMDASAWIDRADAVEDNAVQAACFQKAIEQDPDSEEAHVALGRIYAGEKKLKAATAEYEKAVSINPNNITALKSLLDVYKKRRYRSKIIATYERLASVDEEKAASHYYEAGKVAEQKGAAAKAMSLYRKTLAKNRAHIDARQRLIRIYEKSGQWKRVAGNTKVLLEYDKKNPELYLYLSEAQLKMGNLSGALSAARSAEKLKGTAAVYLQLAYISEKMNRDDDAVAYYRKAVKKNSRNAIAHNNLGLLLEKKKKVKEAIRHYKKAAGLKPKETAYHVNLADAYEKTKQYKKAVAAYRTVVTLERGNRDAWESLAVLYERLKNRTKALDAYRTLAKMAPKKVLWHQKIAQLYEQLGRLRDARDSYKTILGLDPKNSRAKKKYVEISKKLISNKVN